MKVLIPSPLHSYTSQKSSVFASGGTVDEVTRDLDRQFPGIRFRMINEQNQIRPHIKFFINRDQTFDLSTPISEDAELAIIQAFSGG